MAAAPEKLAALRHLLAERFPTVPRTTGRLLRTGIASIDDASGGLPISAVTEIVCAAPSCGGHLLFGQLLALTRRTRQRVALIDSTDSFDPGSFPDDLLAHLVWIRCRDTASALQATDLLARDANFSLLLLDLRRAPAADLRRIPGPQWYRLQRAVEPTDLALVVETPRPSIPSAQLRFTLSTSHSPSALDHERAPLTENLPATLQRQRLQTASA
jgi:RecA/RadA recombinase